MKKCFYFGILLPVCFFACKKSTLPPPQIISVTPGKGSAYNYVQITGVHFDSVASNITASFNGTPGTVYTANDSVLVVIVPSGATTGRITITVNGVSASSTADFIILPGTWVQKEDMPEQLPGDGRALGIGFSIGKYGYMGLGTDNGSDFDDLFRYDPSTDSWSQVASMGFPLETAVSVVINDKAYVGMGHSRLTGDDSNKFFEYDPASNTWSLKKDFPGTTRANIAAFALGNLGYFGGGSLTDFYSYDPSADTWTAKNDFPGTTPLGYPATFVLNSEAYLAGESLNTPFAIQVWKYDALADTWSQKNDIPASNVLFPGTMIINNTAFFMGGGAENWQYNATADSWLQVAFFGTRLGGSIFVVDDKGYYGLGSGFPNYMNSDLWQFTPQ